MTFSGSNLLAALLPGLSAGAGLPGSSPESPGGLTAAMPAGAGEAAVSWSETFTPFLEAAFPAGEGTAEAGRQAPSGVTDPGARAAVSSGRRPQDQEENDPASGALPAIAVPAVPAPQIRQEWPALALSGDVVPASAPDGQPSQQPAAAAGLPAGLGRADAPTTRFAAPLLSASLPAAATPGAAPPEIPFAAPQNNEVQAGGAAATASLPPAAQPGRAEAVAGLSARVAAQPARRMPEEPAASPEAAATEKNEPAPAGLDLTENVRPTEGAAPKREGAETETAQPAVASQSAAAPERETAPPPDLTPWAGTAPPSLPPGRAAEEPAPAEQLVTPVRPSQAAAAPAPDPVAAEAGTAAVRAEWAFAARIVAAPRPAGPDVQEIPPRQIPGDAVRTSSPDSPAGDRGQRAAAPTRPAPAPTAAGAPLRPQAAGEEPAPAGGQSKAPEAPRAARAEARKAAPPGAAPPGRAATRQPGAERPGETSSVLSGSPPAPEHRSLTAADPAPAERPQPVKSTAHAERAATPASPAPAREMRFRLAETGREAAVEVRVKDQAGELRVAVRTSDGALAQSLREGLPELVERLGQQGYEAQLWRPGGSGSPAEPGSSETRIHQAESGGAGGQQGRPGSGQDGSGEGRGSNRRDESPAWNEEWHTSLSTAPEP